MDREYEKKLPPVLLTLKKKAGHFKRRTKSKYNEVISFFIDKYFSRKKYNKYPIREIAIAISTTKGYSEKTVPLLIENLKNLKISVHTIHVFEGGHFDTSATVKHGYHHYFLNNNSFDLTALIGIIELDLQCQYWLLIHDTVSLKKSFRNLFFDIDPIGFDCMPLRPPPAMNIGIYSKEYLQKNKEYLIRFSNKDYTEEGLLEMKKKAFIEEDYLFNTSINKKYIHPELSKYEYTNEIKYFNSKRLLEGYPQLGLKKFKANFSLKNDWKIRL